MNYTLNNIDLETTFGFIPGKAPGSNLALEGAWDMPKRMGKLFHDWGDEDGVEPYVDEEDIRFEGRDISLYGFIDTRTNLNGLKKFLKGFNSLVKLSCMWGSWDVYLKGGLEATNHKDQGFEVIFRFREPVIDLLNISTPENLTLVRNGQSAELSWDAVAEASSYNVYRRSDEGDYVLLTNVLTNSHNDTPT